MGHDLRGVAIHAHFADAAALRVSATLRNHGGRGARNRGGNVLLGHHRSPSGQTLSSSLPLPNPPTTLYLPACSILTLCTTLSLAINTCERMLQGTKLQNKEPHSIILSTSYNYVLSLSLNVPIPLSPYALSLSHSLPHFSFVPSHPLFISLYLALLLNQTPFRNYVRNHTPYD